MGGSGGGGTTRTSTELSPQEEAAKGAALPHLTSLMGNLPLERFAAWSPRQVAGSNQYYEQVKGLTPYLASQTQAQESLFGKQGQGATVFPGVSQGDITAMGGPGSMSVPFGNQKPEVPLNFQAVDLNQIVMDQIRQQLADQYGGVPNRQGQWVPGPWIPAQYVGDNWVEGYQEPDRWVRV